MDKRTQLLVTLSLGVVLLLWLFWPSSAKKHERELAAQAKLAALSANPNSGEYRLFVEQNRNLFTEPNMYSFDKLMEMASSGRLSLVAELWKLRSKCEGGNITTDENAQPAHTMNPDECNIRIENFLREQYPSYANEKLIKLFRTYLQYEDAMRRMHLSEKMPLPERLEALKKKRREFFSESDAKLIFGYEEARAEAQNALNEFYRNSTNMPADERVKKYYEIRRKALGDYDSAFNEQEPKYTRYETELLLREDEMQRKGTTATQTEALREEYFGKEAAKRMAEVDREVREERSRIENYEAQAQKFLRENPSLGESERDKKLTELRTNVLGKEEAAAYQRRMEYENYLKANNLK
ncbi:MAG: Lipase chaperone [Turneriella sp.]|nr:Lipase chaperone [Turneriella sp.]